MRASPAITLLAQRLFDSRYRSWRVLHLYDQSSIPFVLEPNHHRLLGVVHVPEHTLTLLVEGARCDDPRHVRSTGPDASPPPLRLLRIRLGNPLRERAGSPGGSCEPTAGPCLVRGRSGCLRQAPLRPWSVTPFAHPFTPLHLLSHLASLALVSAEGYTPKSLEGVFSEVGLPLYGVLGSSLPASNSQAAAKPLP